MGSVRLQRLRRLNHINSLKVLRKLILLSLCCYSLLAAAHDDLETYYQLDSTEIISVFAGYTIYTTNQRTKDSILTFLDQNGTVKQSIQSAGVQRTGKWHAANNQLCLHWDKKPKEFCFDKVLFHDKLFLLIKSGKIETTVVKTQMGNRTGIQP